jgi:hypothetical protein
MQTPDKIANQADEAMARINQQINRSAGQHLRAVRHVRAGQPVSEGTASAQQILRNASVQRIDTHQLQDTRAIEHFGEASQAAPCPPGFCGLDPKCTDWACPGHPSHITQWTDGMQAEEAEATLNSMRMLAYALVAFAATCCAVVVAFFIGMHI